MTITYIIIFCLIFMIRLVVLSKQSLFIWVKGAFRALLSFSIYIIIYIEETKIKNP